MREDVSLYIRRIRKVWHLYKEAGQLAYSVRQNTNDLELMINIVKKTYSFRVGQQVSEFCHLLELIKQRKPNVILEIGSFRGGSLLLFSQVVPSDATIISLDKNYPIERRIAHSQLIRPGQKLYCINGDSHSEKIYKHIIKIINGKKIDFLFIDGDHTYGGVKKDYELYSQYVKLNGIIAFHDIVPDNFLKFGQKTKSYVGGVPEFWRELIESGHKTETYIDDPQQDGFGIGIIYKTG